MHLRSSSVNGAATYYAIIVLLLTTIVCASLTTLFYYSKVEYHHCEVEQKLSKNVTSALNLMRSDICPVRENESKWVDLFQQGNDSVKLSRKFWGLYEAIGVKAVSGSDSKGVEALVGGDSWKYSNPALYLVDHKRKLHVAGKTKLTGTCFLPSADVERAYIGGGAYTGENLVYGALRKSKRLLPKVNGKLKSRLEHRMRLWILEDDSLVRIASVRDTINHSFSAKTLVLYSDNRINLSSKKISGNVIIVSKREVHVAQSNGLDNVQIYAPYINIEDGTRAKMQLFASDSIEVGKEVKLDYPSSVSLISSSEGKCVIGEYTKIQGAVYVHYTGTDFRKKSRAHLKKGSSILGEVYVHGKLDLQGNVEGSVYADEISLKTAASTHANHLLDVQINSQQVPEYFVNSQLFKSPKNIVSWVK